MWLKALPRVSNAKVGEFRGRSLPKCAPLAVRVPVLLVVPLPGEMWQLPQRWLVLSCHLSEQ